jgi:hypothetical protein
MIPFSILDLSPITEGSDAGASLRNTLELAQHGERWAIAATGWRNITACPASPEPPPRW